MQCLERCLTCTMFWVQAHARRDLCFFNVGFIFLSKFFFKVFLQDFFRFVTYFSFFNLFTKFRFAIYYDWCFISTWLTKCSSVSEIVLTYKQAQSQNLSPLFIQCTATNAVIFTYTSFCTYILFVSVKDLGEIDIWSVGCNVKKLHSNESPCF